MTTTFRTRTAAAALAGARTVLAGCSGGSTTATQTSTAPSTTPASSAAAQPAVTRVELRFAGGSVVGGVGRRAVPLGGTVDLAVSSDVADEVHLHGYDKKVDVPAGGSARRTVAGLQRGTYAILVDGRSTDAVIRVADDG